MTPETLVRALPPAETASRGDHDLNPDLLPGGRLREAAVLVPIMNHAAGLSIVLTQRTQHLAAHAGQIAFPGGGIDPGDETPLAAALRETEEEIGLPADRVRVIGRLDTYITRTGYRVEPFVGLIEPPVALTPEPGEVADIFEVPLAFILGDRMPERHSRRYQGKTRHFYVFPYGERYIWGATAGMLKNLRDRILGS